MFSASDCQVHHQIRMVGCRRQSGLAHSDAMNVAWNCKHTPRTEVAHTNCLAGSSDTYADKTPVPDFGAPFAHPFADGRPYYSGGLSSNGSIDPTSIGL